MSRSATKGAQAAGGWALLVLLTAVFLAMVAQDSERPEPRGNHEVREVGSQAVVGRNGEKRTIPEKIVVDGETYRVVGAQGAETWPWWRGVFGG